MLIDTGDPGAPPSSANVMLPVGVPVPEAGATVAVTVGVCPYTGFPVEGLVRARVTFVARRPVPTTETVCVAAVALRALSVRVTVPVLDPIPVGENVIFTLQIDRGASVEVLLQSVAARGVTWANPLETARPLNVSELFPTFCSDVVIGALVEPTAVDGKVSASLLRSNRTT